MALRTKLNTNDEGETSGFKELDDLMQSMWMK